MRSPLVTYIICAYNGERFIEAAVRSVLDQTYPRIELIVVDDGSTDATPRILQGIRDERLRVVSQPNMGAGFAGNRAVALARGEYIGGLGQDDVLLPEKTEMQLQVLAERGWDFCFTWAEVIDAAGRPTDRWPQELFTSPAPSHSEAMARFAWGNFLCAPSVFSHRRCQAALPRNIALSCVEDYYRWMNLWRRFRGGVLERALVKYRVHDTNVSFDDRYSPEYRQFEERAAKTLALIESDTTRGRRLFWIDPQVQALRQQAEWLMSSGDRGLGLFAYVAANRALNLSPLDCRCYLTLSRVLSWLGFEYPARLLAERAERAARVETYPVPLIPSAPRRLYRSVRSLLLAATRGRWFRLEARMLGLLAGAPAPALMGQGPSTGVLVEGGSSE